MRVFDPIDFAPDMKAEITHWKILPSLQSGRRGGSYRTDSTDRCDRSDRNPPASMKESLLSRFHIVNALRRDIAFPMQSVLAMRDTFFILRPVFEKTSPVKETKTASPTQ